MSVSGESRFFKIASSVRKMVNSKKNNSEEYFSNSDFDTTSTGSNESEVFSTKPSTPESNDNKTSKVSKEKLSKSLRKRFHRHFANVDEDEEVFKKYYCALLGDILLQGSLYITRNYFAFYSNVFGYVTKILIPILTVENITKEKTAKIVPNAIGIVTCEQKHVFGSFMSRDSTLEYMISLWQKAINEAPELAEQEIDSSEIEEAESDKDPSQDNKIQPEGVRKGSRALIKNTTRLRKMSRHSLILFGATTLLILLYISASIMLYRITQIQNKYNVALEDATSSGSNLVYNDFLQWQSKLHSKSVNAVYNVLDASLDEIAKVKESLEALSSLLVDTSNPTTQEVSTNPHETSEAVS